MHRAGLGGTEDTQHRTSPTKDTETLIDVMATISSENHMENEVGNGPLRLLQTSVQTQSTVLISLRNSHKLIATVKAFDKHCNMVLENVREMWYDEVASNGKGKGNGKGKEKEVAKTLRERFVSKMFLRGDSVVVVLRHDG